MLCKCGETNVVELLLEHFNCEENGLHIKDEDGFTSFMVACLNGHKDVVKLLLDHSETNIDLNMEANFWMTAFIVACKNEHKDVVQLFLKIS